MTKHTKGPWSIGLETDELEAQIINVEGMHIATVECDPVMDNARLIAAAPKMKLELECVAIALSDYYEGMEEWDDGLLAGVTEALEEAKGE